MILQDLVQVAREQARQEIPLGCKAIPITAYLLLDADGGNPRFQAGMEKGKTEWGPFISPTNSGKPGLGIHKLEHLVGYRFPRPQSQDEAKQAQSAESKQPLTRTFLEACSGQLASPPLQAVCAFLQRLQTDPDERDRVCAEIRAKNMDTKLNVAVLVDGSEWFQAQEVTDFWQQTGYALSDSWTQQASRQNAAGGKPRKALPNAPQEDASEPCGECLVCGQIKPLARLMDIGLDGFRDKPKLVSFNREAYTSRGLKQTYNAPMCKTCAELAPKGWNELIRREDSHTTIGDHQYVFWGGQPEVMPLRQHNKPFDPKAIQDFIRGGWKQSPQTTAPKRRFHLIGLGSHKSTAYVVAFLNQDADRVTGAVLRWWRWQNLIGDKQTQFFAISDFVRALRPRGRRYGRNATNEADFSTLETNMTRDLFLLSLGEGVCPPAILSRLSDRFATEPEVNVFAVLDRLALLETCLHTLRLGNTPQAEKEMILGPSTPANLSAYNAGRIFYLVVRAQQLAIGEDTAKTIMINKARLAASRPQDAIPDLILRFNTVYLPKLERSAEQRKSGFAKYAQNQLPALVDGVDFASRHTAEQMGWFWKGFYADSVARIKKAGDADDTNATEKTDETTDKGDDNA